MPDAFVSIPANVRRRSGIGSAIKSNVTAA